MSVAFLKDRSLGRIQAGHPWIYSSDVLKIEKEPEDGQEITVRAAKGNFIGVGLYNKKSKIPIRIFSWDKENLDPAFFERALRIAKEYREGYWNQILGLDWLPIGRRFPAELGEWETVGQVYRETITSKEEIETIKAKHFLPQSCRLIWSEADSLPGLIVDKYGDVLVMQTLTLGMDQRKSLLVELLCKLYQPKAIIERNDSGSRLLEGLTQGTGVLWGRVPDEMNVRIGNAKYQLDFLKGHKTGSYLDQVPNHVFVQQLSKGLKVLDCFTYQGGFALHAALGGAASVEALDISEDAIKQCHKNAELNQLKNITWKCANVFDELNARQKRGDKFDLVVLDPPSFTKTRDKLQDALRGYKEIHVRALKLLERGGLLATYCCSHHVDEETFRAVALDSAFDTRKRLRLRQKFTQSWDHPVLPAIPETEYLKGFLFEVL